MNRKEILKDNTIKVNDTVNVHFEINCILYGMPKLKRERGKKMRKKVPGGGVFYMITKTSQILCTLQKSFWSEYKFYITYKIYIMYTNVYGLYCVKHQQQSVENGC